MGSLFAQLPSSGSTKESGSWQPSLSQTPGCSLSTTYSSITQAVYWVFSWHPLGEICSKSTYLLNRWFWPIYRFMTSRNYYKSAALFVILINMNQTYLYFAPVYFVYLLTSCCNPLRLQLTEASKNFLVLSAIAVVGCGVSQGLYVVTDHMQELYSNLFPFRTGLIFHDFWAPNTWALYTGMDFLMIAGNYPDAAHDSETQCTSPMRNAVGAFLPKLYPIHIFLLVCLLLTPILRKLWQSPDKPLVFLNAVVLCCFTVFMFGW